MCVCGGGGYKQGNTVKLFKLQKFAFTLYATVTLKKPNKQKKFFISCLYIWLLIDREFTDTVFQRQGIFFLWVIAKPCLNRSLWPDCISSSEPGSIFCTVGLSSLLVEFIRSEHRQK